ncbi:MAG TPA: hypothetical protein VNG71_23000 [Pyrinomonadaceae bacterium]|nr:hypothetical protein [Pyrinomonadaceae bacterium]
MKRKSNSNESLFNPNQVKREFDRAWPKVVLEIADLLEQPAPRLTKRARKQLCKEFSSGVDAVAPHVVKLEEINGDPTRLREGFENLENILRESLRRTNFKMRPKEDAFDWLVRESEQLLEGPYPLRRFKQFRLVREGVQRLVRSAMTVPGGLKASEELIKEFARKHLNQHIRFANTVDARLKSYQNIDFRKSTARNITRITDLYRDTAMAFEGRLRLLVGLNFIAIGKPKTYSELRRLGYNELLQVVESPKNPLLHFLTGTVNRHVRNALSHNGVSSRLSKRLIIFVDYETEIAWTINHFMREAKKLLLTILGAEYVENEFIYVLNYCTVQAINEIVRTPGESMQPSQPPA